MSLRSTFFSAFFRSFAGSPALAAAVVLFAGTAQAAAFEGFEKTVYDRTHYEVNADRSHTETREWAVKVLSEQGLDVAQSASVAYSEQLEAAEILSAYTLKADGRRVDAPPSNYQVSSNGGRGEAAPMFSDLMTQAVVFPDVAVGDTIVFSYRLTQREPTFPGQFSLARSFSKFSVDEDTEVSLSVPESLALTVSARGVEGGETAATPGRRNWHWHYRNTVLARPESGAVSSFDYGPLIVATTFRDYGEIAAAYEARAKTKIGVTPRIHELAERLTRTAKTPREQVQAIYAWVSKNIKYAGNGVGVGSVVPHEADLVLANRLGDCKDHVVLMQALLADRGIFSSPVLIDSGNTYSLPEAPAIGAFNHVITYVPSLDLYLDATAEGTPFGTLPRSEAGKPVLRTAAFDRVRRTPPHDDRGERWSQSTRLRIDAEGAAEGESRAELLGGSAAGTRTAFAYVQPQNEDATLRGMLSRNGYSGSGELLHLPDDGAADRYVYGARYRLAAVVDLPGPGALPIRSPFAAFISETSLRGAVNDVPRTIDYVCSGARVHEDYTLELPPTMPVLALPRDVNLSGPHASYRAHYASQGNTVTVSRDFEDATPGPTCTPKDREAYKPFAAAVLRDLRAQLVFR